MVGLQLGIYICTPHTCVCGASVDVRKAPGDGRDTPSWMSSLKVLWLRLTCQLDWNHQAFFEEGGRNQFNSMEHSVGCHLYRRIRPQQSKIQHKVGGRSEMYRIKMQIVGWAELSFRTLCGWNDGSLVHEDNKVLWWVGDLDFNENQEIQI